jgi:hypothetical protein
MVNPIPGMSQLSSTEECDRLRLRYNPKLGHEQLMQIDPGRRLTLIPRNQISSLKIFNGRIFPCKKPELSVE